jgi:uncharacterized protein YwgA
LLSRDIPLILASDLAASGEERYPLDRLRMQKAIFLISQRGTDRLRMYHFDPYNWGPYSSELARDLNGLTHVDLLTDHREPGHGYLAYKTSFAGEVRAAELWTELAPNEQEFIRRVRTYVTNKSFNHLLREVYAAYPDYATKSQFTG